MGILSYYNYKNRMNIAKFINNKSYLILKLLNIIKINIKKNYKDVYLNFSKSNMLHYIYIINKNTEQRQ